MTSLNLSWYFKFLQAKLDIDIFNSFVHNSPFLNPPENIYFQGIEKGCIGNEWVNET